MKKQLAFVFAALVIIYASGCKNVANYPISQPSADCIEDGIIGKWKFREDTDRNNFYEVYKADAKNKNAYHVRFWNWSGLNPTYEANIHFSKIDGILFINVPYWEGDNQKKGFGFLKVTDINPDFDKMTVAAVNDTTMRSLKSSDDVRALITKNVNNPAFYRNSLHFFKIK